MSKHVVDVGSIVLIPAGSNGYVVSKVLYRSDYYDSVILLGIFAMKTEVKDMPDTLPSDFAAEYYTTQCSIRAGRWHLVGCEALRENQKNAARRIVAGEVWLDDTHLGPASAADKKSLPHMGVKGAKLVEILVEELMV